MNSSPSDHSSADYAIIVVTHNSAPDILPCLDSLKTAAPGACLQRIIVDNDSTDGTPELLRHLHSDAKDGSELILINNRTNRGFTAALNQARTLVSAPFVLFLNPDTVLPANGLSKLCAKLSADATVGAVAPQFRNADGSVQPSCRRFPRHRDVIYTSLGLSTLFPDSRELNYWKMGEFNHQHERIVDQPQGAFLLARREVFNHLGPWDERFPMFFSDVDWCKRLYAAGYRILFTPEVAIRHLKGRSVHQNRPAMILSSHRSFRAYFVKHYRGWRWLLPNGVVWVVLCLGAVVRYTAAHLKLWLGRKAKERKR